MGLGLVLGILLIFFWLKTVQPAQLWSQIKQVSAAPLAAALLVYLLAYFVRSIRWHLLMDSSAKPSALRVWSYSLVGNMINYLIPIRAGELAKAWLLKTKENLPLGSSLSIIFVDKTFDTIGIFLALALLPFLALKLNLAMYILMGALSLVFVISVSLLFFAVKKRQKMTGLMQKLLSWLPQGLQIKMDRFIEHFVAGMDIFGAASHKLPLALGLTILGVILDGSYFWLIFLAFGLKQAFSIVLFGYTLINLSYALPQPPAQLGSNQWMMIIIFSAGFGLTKESASAVMALAHVLTAALIILGGSLALVFTGGQIIKKVITGENLYE